MLALAFLLILASSSQLEAAEINCEVVYRYKRFEKCCYFDRDIVIDALNVTIAGLENSDVEAIQFSGNEKVEFLPVNVYKNYPNLEVYLAGFAAVKEISAFNFARLLNLKSLDLKNNAIKFIPHDCFQGLTKLNQIDLSTNLTITKLLLKKFSYRSQ